MTADKQMDRKPENSCQRMRKELNMFLHYFGSHCFIKLNVEVQSTRCGTQYVQLTKCGELYDEEEAKEEEGNQIKLALEIEELD